MFGQVSLEGFTEWVNAVMGVPTQYLPSGSPALFWAYGTALAIVNPAFKCLPGICIDGVRYPNPLYAQAVYNLGGNNLANFAPDVSGLIYKDEIGYFAFMRKDMNINQFTPGVITSSADETTSESMEVPEQFKNMTLSQLQLLKTPWGRTYLGIAQDYGTNWGMS